MTDTIDFHDYTIESLFVEARVRRLVLRTFNAHAPSSPSLVAEFRGVAGYCLVGDVLGTIVFELEECQHIELYRRFASHMQAAYTATGGHDPWVATEREAVAFLAEGGIRGFEITSSVGAIGGIWCRGFKTWTEPDAAA